MSRTATPTAPTAPTAAADTRTVLPTLAGTTGHAAATPSAAWRTPMPRERHREVPGGAQLLHTAKVAYTARHAAPLLTDCHLTAPQRAPRRDELVLARVVELGQHTGLALGTGRRATLFVGDHVVVAYGARYAPDQFRAVVPADLGVCDLAAAGGVAGRVIEAHAKMRPPTRLEPVGLVTNPDGTVLTVATAAPVPPVPSLPRRRSGGPAVLAVLGSSMNAGKTTAMASLVRGLSLAGYRVGAAKVTGTGAPGDPSLFRDAGAATVLDFTDAGHATTNEVPLPTLLGIAQRLVARLADEGAEVVVLEVADGLLQEETAALIASHGFATLVDATVFAAADAMGAGAGAATLRQLGLDVLAVTGLVTASPLAADEAQRVTEAPVVATGDLTSPEVASALLRSAQRAAA
jgi:hypothetical protein